VKQARNEYTPETRHPTFRARAPLHQHSEDEARALWVELLRARICYNRGFYTAALQIAWETFQDAHAAELEALPTYLEKLRRWQELDREFLDALRVKHTLKA
jgi:hypothetical protein